MLSENIYYSYTYTIELDIDSFYDNVPYHIMDKLLRNYSIDDITMSLIQKFLVCGVVRDFSVFPNGKVEIRKETRNEKVNLFEWKSTSIQQTNAEYHLIADGIFTQ